jgi:nitrate reductase beta subunit
MLTAGNEQPVAEALERLLAMRAYMRARTVDGEERQDILDQVGLTGNQVQDMVRYLAIGNYEDRFVIPTSHREYAENAFELKGGCGFSFGNGCSGGVSSGSLFGHKPEQAPASGPSGLFSNRPRVRPMTATEARRAEDAATR